MCLKHRVVWNYVLKFLLANFKLLTCSSISLLLRQSRSSKYILCLGSSPLLHELEIFLSSVWVYSASIRSRWSSPKCKYGKAASSSLHSHHLEDTVDSLWTFSFVGVLEGLIQFVGRGGMKLKGKPEFGCGGRYIWQSFRW